MSDPICEMRRHHGVVIDGKCVDCGCTVAPDDLAPLLERLDEALTLLRAWKAPPKALQARIAALLEG